MLFNILVYETGDVGIDPRANSTILIRKLLGVISF